MSNPAWRDATLEDRAELKTWICADPPKRQFERATASYSHPEQWVLDVQSGLRELNPPLSGDERLVLTRDDVGIAAVAYFAYDRREQEFWLLGLASAPRVRRRGFCRTGHDFVMGEILSWRAELGVVGGVLGRIHERNMASKGFFTSTGWQFTEVKAGAYELWELALNVEAGVLEDEGTLEHE
ncbi:hypothetical protein ACFWE5_00900 [Cellulosimicrobium funkei]|uniref:hypothetical protein n=1 Tax=Cellulosimicrobium funkei TaxID=264251 RepID=UPI00365264D6